jgi:hypothetical protein
MKFSAHKKTMSELPNTGYQTPRRQTPEETLQCPGAPLRPVRVTSPQGTAPAAQNLFAAFNAATTSQEGTTP